MTFSKLETALSVSLSRTIDRTLLEYGYNGSADNKAEVAVLTQQLISYVIPESELVKGYRKAPGLDHDLEVMIDNATELNRFKYSALYRNINNLHHEPYPQIRKKLHKLLLKEYPDGRIYTDNFRQFIFVGASGFLIMDLCPPNKCAVIQMHSKAGYHSEYHQVHRVLHRKKGSDEFNPFISTIANMLETVEFELVVDRFIEEEIE